MNISLLPIPQVLRASVFLAVLLPVLAACNQSDEKPDNPPVAVLVEKVVSESYSPSGRITGEVRARVQSELSFQVAGRILERTVSVGDHVEAGQVLARLDPIERQADVKAAEAGLTAAEAVLRQAESTFQRQEALLAKKIATRKDYDAAQQALQTTRASAEIARNQLATSREQLSYTVLKAEKAGVVTALNAEAGQVVQAAYAVYSIAEDGPRDAVFDLDESVLSWEGVPPEITISLVTDPSVKAKGVIWEISPTVDQTRGTVRVKVEIQNPPEEMSFGAAVVGQAELSPVKAVVLPSEALFSDHGKPAVWLVNPEDKRVSLRMISISAYEAENIVISDGLKDGELVVTLGGQLLHPGQPVKPIEGAAQ